MADPTAAQRKMYAKMGLAMPDGSYYIRTGPEGASDLDNAIHRLVVAFAPSIDQIALPARVRECRSSHSMCPSPLRMLWRGLVSSMPRVFSRTATLRDD